MKLLPNIHFLNAEVIYMDSAGELNVSRFGCDRDMARIGCISNIPKVRTH